MTTIWVAAVDHKHGTNLYAGATEDAAYAEVAEYCRQSWVADGPDQTWSSKPPSEMTDREIVSEYFEWQSEIGGSEWFVVQETELATEPPPPGPYLSLTDVMVGMNEFLDEAAALGVLKIEED